MAQAGSVQFAIRQQEIGAKLTCNGSQGGFARCRELSGDLVGVYNGNTLFGKQLGYGTFAAADAAGQSDDQFRAQRRDRPV